MKELKYGRMCRTCINQHYNVKLNRKDCIYNEPYPALCEGCGNMKYIVMGLRLMGKIKMLFKK